MKLSEKSPRPLEAAVEDAHGLSGEQALEKLDASVSGLSEQQVEERRAQYGSNRLPHKLPPGLLVVFIKQFQSPLIYVLLAAALVSLFIGEFSDAAFIGAVLLLNAVIGSAQEYSAQRSADALQKLMMTQVRVQRAGDAYEIDSEQIVPGDIVLLESGDRVPADLRILDCHSLEIDESLLTGESMAVS